ncbi:MAG: hypothetical protein KAQ96_14215, partial [Thermoplasmata archaeon]|nr:hypothetical protein [Thermoplasmata archaeon]
MAVRPALLFSDDIQARAESYSSVEVSVKPSPGFVYVSTIGPPGGDIRIDGNFDDWLPFGIKGEPTGDVRNRALDNDPDYPYSTKNRNVDINGIQVKMTPTAGPTKVNFMVSTVGHILHGMVVDNPTFPGISTPGGPQGEPAENRYLEDRTVIYVDRDPTNDPQQVTGARVVPNDPTYGADVVINVAGKFGRVISTLSDMHQWTVSGWQKIQGQVPSAASDYHRLEVSVPLGTLGMNPTVTPETYFVTTDWRGNYDDTQPYANRGPTAGSVFAEERSVAPPTVRRGDENVPILRIDLENREHAPAMITDVYALLVGTATESDIDAIRLWTGDRVINTFDTERFEEVSK